MKRLGRLACYRGQPSPPARGRGLKPTKTTHPIRALQSPPARGRGLKQDNNVSVYDEDHVAPRAGAWIETQLYIS